MKTIDDRKKYVSSCCGHPMEYWGYDKDLEADMYSPHCGKCNWDAVMIPEADFNKENKNEDE